MLGLVDGVPACGKEWNWMSFKVPFQLKLFHDSMTLRSLTGRCSQAGVSVFFQGKSKRTRGYGLKLCQGKNFFMERVLRH